MQCYATEVDPNLTFDQLPPLRSKPKLSQGFRFKVKTLDSDLTISPTQVSNHTAHIVRDELHNVYKGCGFTTPAATFGSPPMRYQRGPASRPSQSIASIFCETPRWKAGFAASIGGQI